MSIRAVWVIFVVLLAVVAFSGSQAIAVSDGSQTLYFNATGAGLAGRTVFRTQFELSNEKAEPANGLLDFFAADGSPFEPKIAHTWFGEEGSLEVSGSRVAFLIQPRSSLVLTLVPLEGGSLGWSRFETYGCVARVVLQVAALPDPHPPSPPDFEHYIQNIAEIEPTRGVKSFTFPIWLFEGIERISTAFAVVNLSGVPSEVIFHYRDGFNQTPLTKTVTLRSGEIVADYFDRFWSLGFPEIFPFEMRASAEVESAAPLGVTVFRTLGELPVSGLKVLEKPKTSKRIEADLNTEFELTINESGVIEAENLRIDFWNVPEDSRCPEDVVCVWEGRAAIELNIFHKNQGPHRLRLATDDEIARFEDYSLQLVKVAPAPVSTEQLKISDYRITLIVTRE
jgi:hypothetical protein